MSELFVAIVVWLGLGGWSYRCLSESSKSSDLAGLIWACLLFAPFAAGAALAEIAYPKFKPGTTEKAKRAPEKPTP